MKFYKALFILVMVFCLSGFVLASPSEAQQGYGMHQQGMWNSDSGGDQSGQWSYCPYCGSDLRGRRNYPMGPGRMGPGYKGYGMMGRGYYGHHDMGPGMMGPGYYDYRGMGPGMMGPGYERDYRRYEKPLNKEEAKQAVEKMIEISRNPNLKTGDIEDNERFFVVEVLTQEDSLVDKVQVDKDTGLMRSIY